MSEFERFLVWHYKHHYVFTLVWAWLGVLVFPPVCMTNSMFWFYVRLFLWYTVYSLVPAGWASVATLKITEQIGLLDPEP